MLKIVPTHFFLKMTDKSITNTQAGEYLQFQRSAVPEQGYVYALGTRNNPFYSLHSIQIPVNNIEVYPSTVLPTGTVSAQDPYPVTPGSSEVGIIFCASNGTTPVIAVSIPTGTYNSTTGRTNQITTGYTALNTF